MIKTHGRRHVWEDQKGVAIVQLVVHFHSNGSFQPADHRGPDEYREERLIDRVTTDLGVEISAEQWKALEDLLQAVVDREPMPDAAS